VIYCGEMDTRLNPISYFIPKELIPIGNKPILVYTIELLLKSGMNDLAILVNEYNKQIFKKVLRRHFKEDFYYIVLPEPKGMANDLYLLKNSLKKKGLLLY